MNYAKTIPATGLLMAVIAIPRVVRGDVEVYQLTTPITGSLQGAISDYANSIGPGNYPEVDLNWNFSTLNETIYLDTANLTVEQVGTVSLQGPTNPGGHINENQTIHGHGIMGSLSISQVMSFAFNTGPQPIVWNASSQSYVLNQALGGNAIIGNIPVSGTYALTTGGQTYNGSFNYTLAPDSGGPLPTTFSSFSPVLDSSMLKLDGLSGQNSYLSGGRSAFAQINADNGYSMSLGIGAGDYLDSFDWSSGAVTASQAPEPNTLALIAFGLTGLFSLRRRI